MADRTDLRLDARASERVATVVARLTATDVHVAVAALDRRQVERMAGEIGLPPTMLRRDASIDRALRRRLRRVSTGARVEVYGLLAAGVLADLRRALGPDRVADPSTEDLESVLPPVIDRFGPRLVALCLTLVVAAELQAAAVCDRMLDDDPRFAPDGLGPEVLDDLPVPAPDRVAPRTESAAADEQRAARRARKEAARARGGAVRPTRPVRYRRSCAPVVPEPTAPDVPVVPGHGAPVAVGRRTIRVVHRYPDLHHDDPMVGRIVWAVIRFGGPVVGEKLRPCVVVAASGERHLVVRPCYSEGGRIADDYSSVPISDLAEAQLSRPTRVSIEERRIHRAGIRSTAGWMPVPDWNQL